MIAFSVLYISIFENEIVIVVMIACFQKMYNFKLENEIIIVVMIACFLFNIISPIYRGERVGVYHS